MKRFNTYICGIPVDSITEAEKRLVVFERMSHDLCVMAEWGDDDNALWEEVSTCDPEILSVYFETFCASEKVPCI